MIIKKLKAVTLIELLVTMGILVLLVSILYSVFNVSLKAWRKSDNMMQVTSVSRMVLEKMSKEISSMMVRPGNQFKCMGFNGPSTYRPNSQGDEFYFIAPVNPGNNPIGFSPPISSSDQDNMSDLCEVGYWLGLDSNGKKTLMNFIVPDDRAIDSGSPEFDFDFSTEDDVVQSNYELAGNVTNLEFEFYKKGDTTAYETWDSTTEGGPPSKIKIIIEVAIGKGTESTNPDLVKKEFTTIVSLPN